MKSAIQNIFMGSLQMYGARIVLLILGILQNFILAKILGPSGFGEISLFNLVLVYAGFTGLGFDTVAAREIPGYVVLNKKKETDQVLSLSFTIEMSLRIIISIIIALIGFFFLEGTLRVGVLLISPILLVQKVSAYWRAMANALKKFSILSKSSMFDGLLMGIFIIILVKFTGVYTRLLAILCTQIIVGAYLINKMHLDLKLMFRSNRFWEILKMGFPFVALTMVYYIWQVSDRTLIASFMNLKILGLYSFAVSCVSLLLLFSEDANTVLQPFMYERISIGRDKKEILQMIRKPTIFFAYSTPVVIFFSWVLYPSVLKYMIPEYLDSVWVFRILLFQFYLINVNTAVNYLIRSREINKQSWLALTYIVAGIVSYLSILLFWRMGLGMIGAALGVVLANLVAVGINFSITQRYYLENLKSAIKYYTFILAPVVYTGLCLLLFEIAIAHNLLKPLSLQLFVVAGLTFPLIFIVNRELGLVRELSILFGHVKKRVVGKWPV